jgi:hypothetical protein
MKPKFVHYNKKYIKSNKNIKIKKNILVLKKKYKGVAASRPIGVAVRHPRMILGLAFALHATPSHLSRWPQPPGARVALKLFGGATPEVAGGSARPPPLAGSGLATTLFYFIKQIFIFLLDFVFFLL